MFDKEARRRELLAEIEAERQKLLALSRRQQRWESLRCYQMRLGPMPPDSVAVRFASQQEFESFVRATGAGSWCIEGPGARPIAMLHIDAADEALSSFDCKLLTTPPKFY